MRLQQLEKEELHRLIEHDIVTAVLMDDEVSQESYDQQNDYQDNETSKQDTNSYISIHEDVLISSYEHYTTTTAETTDDE